MLKLYNTLTNSVDDFVPINKNHISMYVCGPTVYDRPHVGNGRPAVVFDVLYRLLRYLYPKVTYVRNITDIDDKIYKQSIEKSISINEVAVSAAQVYHSNLEQLGVLPVDVEPRATGNIDIMIKMIADLVAARKAYVAGGHVYFDSSSYEHYGALSNHNIKEQIAGARVSVSDNKRSQNDFVLWKPISDEFNIGWDSPWGVGRPGWHIECSAMSRKILGDQIDIHGGGIDLIFPHHENENAQSCAITGKKSFANYWIHNGHINFLDQKMSKSIGNTVYLSSLLNQYSGASVKFAILSTHYASPINWSDALLQNANIVVTKWWQKISQYDICADDKYIEQEVVEQLLNDLNTPGAFAVMHKLFNQIKNSQLASNFYNTCINLLGLQIDQRISQGLCDVDEQWVVSMLKKRTQFKNDKNYLQADKIRDDLSSKGIVIEDDVDGTTRWRKI